MGLENTSIFFLPLQLSNVNAAAKNRKEVGEKSKQEDVKGVDKCS